MKKRGVAQFGRALGSGPRGRWFESSHSDHNADTKKMRPPKSPILSGFFATQTAILLYAKM